MAGTTGGYAGKFLRVNLSTRSTDTDVLPDAELRKWVGGTGTGTRYLYSEVPPGVEWSDPANPVFIATGPMAGTTISGSGTFSVVFKGAMTNMGGATQANGYLGAFLKFCGYDGIFLQGACDRLSYLLIKEDGVELRDASHLAGKTSWEVEDLIREEFDVSPRQMSVFSIGPAGEHMVRYAGFVGDRGHIAAHNGIGAVLGSKKLKAIAVARGKLKVPIHDTKRLSVSVEALFGAASTFGGGSIYNWGTAGGVSNAAKGGWLPVKNYTTNIYQEHEQVSGQYMRTRFKQRKHPCWACRISCCRMLEVTEGPYKGFVGEEPEYEAVATFGPQIGVTDAGAVVMLSNEADKLGLDLNETGWVLGMAIELHEKGLLNTGDLDGIDLRWGNPEAAREMMGRIARREGFGSVLAEGAKRAAEQIGGDAPSMAIYTLKGNTPRSHDHRGRWSEMFDTCLSNTGTIEATFGGVQTVRLGLPPLQKAFSPEEVSTAMGQFNGWHQFEDCLGACRFTVTSAQLAVEALNAITGWDFTVDETLTVGRRVVNQLRAFGFRHGLQPELERPSPRYGSTPVDGPVAGVGISSHWNEMVRNYRQLMGWDVETGKPLPETLQALGLGSLISDLWHSPVEMPLRSGLPTSERT